MPKQTQKPRLFGIKNCDSVKKARMWLESNGVDFDYHDFRDDGLAASTLEEWLAIGVSSSLINKRSTTWKQMSADLKSSLEAMLDEADGKLTPTGSNKKLLIKTLQEHPTLIKRPVVHWPSNAGSVSMGFKAEHFSEHLRQ